MNTLSINFRLLRVLSGFPTADDVFLPAISLPAKPPEDPIRAGVAGRRELEAVRESLVLSEAPKAPMSSPPGVLGDVSCVRPLPLAGAAGGAIQPPLSADLLDCVWRGVRIEILPTGLSPSRASISNVHGRPVKHSL